jgi:hypothetical protein
MSLAAETMSELAGLEALARLGLAFAFATAAFLKLRSPADARQAVAAIGLGPSRSKLAVLALAALELAVASALLFSGTALVGALAALALLLAFTAVVVWSRARGRRAPCGCFGRSPSDESGVLALARNAFLIAVTVLVIALAWRGSSPGVPAWLAALPPSRLLALLTGGVAVVLAAGAALALGRRLRAGWTPVQPSSVRAGPPDASHGSDEGGGQVVRLAGGTPALTIGMATFGDFDGVYFTLQSLRLYHDLKDTELIVVDNRGDDAIRHLVEGWLGGRYILATEVVGTAYPRDLVFREARGEAVLCCDSHVLFAEGAISRLKRFYAEYPRSEDLLQGPLVYDDTQLLATHMKPQWREQMWGTWASDPRGRDPDSEPFEIPMQGLGAFSCRRHAWLGFHPAFRGFGGEEGYIHEKFRRAGRRTLCLPGLRWLHRFNRPGSVLFPLLVEDKLRNYLIGHLELGLDTRPVLEHFSAYLSDEALTAVLEDAARTVARPESPLPVVAAAR